MDLVREYLEDPIESGLLMTLRWPSVCEGSVAVCMPILLRAGGFLAAPCFFPPGAGIASGPDWGDGSCH